MSIVRVRQIGTLVGFFNSVRVIELEYIDYSALNDCLYTINYNAKVMVGKINRDKFIELEEPIYAQVFDVDIKSRVISSILISDSDDNRIRTLSEDGYIFALKFCKVNY